MGACIRAVCGRDQLVVSIWPLDIIEGDAPIGVRQRVLAWAAQHQQELLATWRRGLYGLETAPMMAARGGRFPALGARRTCAAKRAWG
jgi:hypothetical protein